MRKNNRLPLLLTGFLLTGNLLAQAKVLDSLPDRLKWDNTKINTVELKTLLLNPLNLQTFKRAKTGRSNSGGAANHSYFYRPDHKGFYYFYFVFNNYVEHGPRITTYKKGNTVNDYMDTSEVFIQLACDALDKDLGKANLLSLSAETLLKKFGDNYLKKGETLAYQYKRTLLLVSYSPNRNWFKIVRLNKSFNSFEEIEQAEKLLSYY